MLISLQNYQKKNIININIKIHSKTYHEHHYVDHHPPYIPSLSLNLIRM